MLTSRACAFLLSSILLCAANCGGQTNAATIGNQADAQVDTGRPRPPAITGRVERVIGKGLTYDEPVSFGADSEAHISLVGTDSPGGEGPAVVLTEVRLSPVPALPFDFELPAYDAKQQFSDYFVQAELHQKRDGNTVGDMVTETVTTVSPPASGVIVQVSGLELCLAPNAGGYCL